MMFIIFVTKLLNSTGLRVKRLIDFFASLIGLILASPVLLLAMFLIWKQDLCSPFYISNRVGKNEKIFRMVKLRSMIVNKEGSGPDSTGSNDQRITRVGHIIRRFKLDELSQLWNVLSGEMSLVGPRPNVKTETDLYTNEEKGLLLIKPGITDFSSIIFSDEGEILKDKDDPDLAYNQLIRPWKSRLGLIYIGNQSMLLDIQLIIYTFVSIISKKHAISLVVRKLEKIGADKKVIEVSKRNQALQAYPPPGSEKIVENRYL